MSQSVQRAFEIIRKIADHQGEHTLSDLSRILQMNKTTTFRYLDSLEKLDILERRRNTYFLGIGLFELGAKVDAKTSIVNNIHPILEDLCLRMNETVNLARLSGDQATYLDKVESTRGMQMKATVGDKLPLYCTGVGKAVLSILPPEQSNQLVKNIELKAITSHTLTDRGALKQALDDIRNNGFSIDDEEYEFGLTCVAVPLRLEKYNFFGAISLSGQTVRFSEEDISRMVEALKTARQRILAVFE